jgi:tRNA pseudouridine synthase 10
LAATGAAKPPRPRRRAKVYLESRYRKLERGLPQTVFYCPECKGDRKRASKCERCEGFGKLTRDSVQELLARVLLPAFKARYGKFHGAGREDLDVLMLGRGRPFVFEIVGARNPAADLAAIDARLLEIYAGRLELEPLRQVARQQVAYWKESQFDKCYRVAVESPESIDPSRVTGLVGRVIEVAQRTPQRVAHRRADLERSRTVNVIAAAALGETACVLEIRCQHGTYVKEWVSGDDGRTSVALADLLGVECACVQLDVLEILTETDKAVGADPGRS